MKTRLIKSKQDLQKVADETGHVFNEPDQYPATLVWYWFFDGRNRTVAEYIFICCSKQKTLNMKTVNEKQKIEAIKQILGEYEGGMKIDRLARSVYRLTKGDSAYLRINRIWPPSRFIRFIEKALGNMRLYGEINIKHGIVSLV